MSPRLPAAPTTLFLAVLAGCGGAPTPAAPSRLVLDAPAVTPVPVPTLGPPVPGGTCPTGMVPVPKTDPRYCIDAYEVSLDGGRAVSRPGVLPAVGISFAHAMQLCAARTLVDASGGAHGTAHLATSAEWEDAADGVVGPGGSRYPMGDVLDPDACATLDASGTERYRSLQPTGSLPRCVSAFGLYDQLGNAWEWADSGARVDIHAWGPRTSMTVDTSDRLYTAPDQAGAMTVLVNAQMHGTTSPEGLLLMTPEGATAPGKFLKRGWLRERGARPDDAAALLPIRLSPYDPARPGGSQVVVVDRAEDGQPIPDKRGCAHYVGDLANCTNATANLGHTRDFDGSIGFRCASAPIGR